MNLGGDGCVGEQFGQQVFLRVEEIALTQVVLARRFEHFGGWRVVFVRIGGRHSDVSGGTAMSEGWFETCAGLIETVKGRTQLRVLCKSGQERRVVKVQVVSLRFCISRHTISMRRNRVHIDCEGVVASPRMIMSRTRRIPGQRFSGSESTST